MTPTSSTAKAPRWPDIRRALFALASVSLIRLRELDGGLLRVARPKGHENTAAIDIDPQTGTWLHARLGTEGVGYFPLMRYLAIDLGDALAAAEPTFEDP